MIGLASALLVVVAVGSTAVAQPFDHLACSRVKDPAPRAAYTATLLPSDSGLPPSAGCLIKVPAKQVCIDVEKNGITPAPPGAPAGGSAQRYLCYKVKCPRNEYSLSLQDQFGSREVIVKKPGLLCAPVVTTTTTTSTTTTS